MSLTVKAYLKRGENVNKEIRRFSLDQGVATNYEYLSKTVAHVFPSLGDPDNFTLAYKGRSSQQHNPGVLCFSVRPSISLNCLLVKVYFQLTCHQESIFFGPKYCQLLNLHNLRIFAEMCFAVWDVNREVFLVGAPIFSRFFANFLSPGVGGSRYQLKKKHRKPLT
jgi:hypothetical protein